MYSFFVLLPLTLIALGLGSIIGSSPQVADYIEYATDIPDQAHLLKKFWTDKRLWAQISAHMVAYAVLCFAMVTTVRTISQPLPANRVGMQKIQLFLEVLFVSLPSTVLLWVIGHQLKKEPGNAICWLAVVALAIGLAVSVALTAKRKPLELYNSFVPPFQITKIDVAAGLCVIAIAVAVTAFALFPEYSAYHLGIFSVVMLVTAAIYLIIAAILARHVSPVAIISLATSGIIVLYFINSFFPARQFRYNTVALKADEKLDTVAAKKLRNIPNLPTAFHRWLEYRRPAIEEYRKIGQPYPVFIVSAQGGGMYAAYHPALSLARLTDFCPEFSHHLFGISSVSGGSLGAAVFAELLRTFPPDGNPAAPVVGCSRFGPMRPHNVLERHVGYFFNNDFLSRVVGSALLFDLPTALVPLLRFSHDRAWALEYGFEDAWRNISPKGNGLSGDFLERWDATAPIPALFMSTTGVNFGIPVLISQVDWSHNPSNRVSIRQASTGKDTAVEKRVASNAPEADLVNRVSDQLNRNENPLRIGVANLLDFRPDVQLATSTAVVLSARFPFVTPPGNIIRSDQFTDTPGSIFDSIQELQLTDGGFYDNSGAIVARDMIGDLNKSMETDDRLKPYKDLIKFRLIRFIDTPAKRQALVSKKAYPELLSTLVAYNSVRLSRGVPLATPLRTDTSNIYLLDEWYDGVLNWLLAGRTELDIQLRSSWAKGSNNDVCCEVRRDSSSNAFKRIRLTQEEVEKLQTAAPKLIIDKFIPNAGEFDEIFSDLNPGASPSLWHPPPGE